MRHIILNHVIHNTQMLPLRTNATQTIVEYESNNKKVTLIEARGQDPDEATRLAKSAQLYVDLAPFMAMPRVGATFSQEYFAKGYYVWSVPTATFNASVFLRLLGKLIDHPRSQADRSVAAGIQARIASNMNPAYSASHHVLSPWESKALLLLFKDVDNQIVYTVPPFAQKQLKTVLFEAPKDPATLMPYSAGVDYIASATNEFWDTVQQPTMETLFATTWARQAFASAVREYLKIRDGRCEPTDLIFGRSLFGMIHTGTDFLPPTQEVLASLGYTTPTVLPVDYLVPYSNEVVPDFGELTDAAGSFGNPELKYEYVPDPPLLFGGFYETYDVLTPTEVALHNLPPGILDTITLHDDRCRPLPLPPLEIRGNRIHIPIYYRPSTPAIRITDPKSGRSTMVYFPLAEPWDEVKEVVTGVPYDRDRKFDTSYRTLRELVMEHKRSFETGQDETGTDVVAAYDPEWLAFDDIIDKEVEAVDNSIRGVYFRRLAAEKRALESAQQAAIRQQEEAPQKAQEAAQEAVKQLALVYAPQQSLVQAAVPPL